MADPPPAMDLFPPLIPTPPQATAPPPPSSAHPPPNPSLSRPSISGRCPDLRPISGRTTADPGSTASASAAPPPASAIPSKAVGSKLGALATPTAHKVFVNKPQPALGYKQPGGSYLPKPKLDKPWMAAVSSNLDEHKLKLTYTPPLVENGQIVVEASDQALAHARSKWANYLVGYFIEGRLPFTSVQEMAKRLWAKHGLEQTLCFNKEFFFFKFQDETTRAKLLEHGPFLFGGRPIILQQWSPSVQLGKATHRKIPVWAKFHNIPLALWNSIGLGEIASAIGRPLYADTVTDKLTRFEFARICVEIDASKPLIDCFSLRMDGETSTIKVEYQWRPKRCAKCSVFGHDCEKKTAVAPVQAPTLGQEQSPAATVGHMQAPGLVQPPAPGHISPVGSISVGTKQAPVSPMQGPALPAPGLLQPPLGPTGHQHPTPGSPQATVGPQLGPLQQLVDAYLGPQHPPAIGPMLASSDPFGTEHAHLGPVGSQQAAAGPVGPQSLAAEPIGHAVSLAPDSALAAPSDLHVDEASGDGSGSSSEESDSGSGSGSSEEGDGSGSSLEESDCGSGSSAEESDCSSDEEPSSNRVPTNEEYSAPVIALAAPQHLVDEEYRAPLKKATAHAASCASASINQENRFSALESLDDDKVDGEDCGTHELDDMVELGPSPKTRGQKAKAYGLGQASGRRGGR